MDTLLFKSYVGSNWNTSCTTTQRYWFSDAGPYCSDKSVFLVSNWFSQKKKTCYIVKRLSKCWSLVVAGNNCFSLLINTSVQLFEIPPRPSGTPWSVSIRNRIFLKGHFWPLCGNNIFYYASVQHTFLRTLVNAST